MQGASQHSHGVEDHTSSPREMARSGSSNSNSSSSSGRCSSRTVPYSDQVLTPVNASAHQYDSVRPRSPTPKRRRTTSSSSLDDLSQFSDLTHCRPSEFEVDCNVDDAQVQRTLLGLCSALTGQLLQMRNREYAKQHSIDRVKIPIEQVRTVESVQSVPLNTFCLLCSMNCVEPRCPECMSGGTISSTCR